MAGNIKMTRLGDILREKGLISADQLGAAIVEQQRRRQGISASDKNAMDATSIGEILIDLGYITRQQLKRGLNWQMYLRKMTLVMSFCAPLMTLGSGGVAAQTSSSSSASRTSVSSLVIEAESYSAMQGVKTQATSDVGGGLNVGYIDGSDWMNYDNAPITATTAGVYKITYRVASLSGGGKFTLRESNGSAEYDVVDVPKTGGWQTWADYERFVTLPAGTHKLGIAALNQGFNLNWFKVEYVGEVLPMTIEAESYATMSGVKTQTTTDKGAGLNVSYIDAGDWMSYENRVVGIPATGQYKITYRVASLAGGGSFSLRAVDGSVEYDKVTVPSTGSWQKWVDVERVVTLTQGSHLFGITALTAGFNLNWFKIEPVVASDTSSSVSSAPSVSSAASSVKSSTASSVSSVPASSAPASSAPASSAPASSAPASSAASSSASSLTTFLHIEAESYSAMQGVKTQTTTDVGGGLNVGYIEGSDWMNYDNSPITVTTASVYKITYRVASLSGGGKLTLRESDGSADYDVVEVPKTGGYQVWTNVERMVTLPAGAHKLGILALSQGVNLNWIDVEYVGEALPMTIEAESYAAMNGVKTQTTTDAGAGLNVAYIDAGDWMSYENRTVGIPATGQYKITYRVASLAGGGSFKLHAVDGSVVYDQVTVPSTGAWQKWVDVERVVTLSQGAHMFGITALTTGFNLNWFKIEPVSASGTNSSVSSAAASSAPSTTSSAAVSSAPSVSSASSSSTSSVASSAASLVASAYDVAGSVYLEWNIPRQREDGTVLDINELGGYEVRYRKVTDDEYTYVSIEDAWTNRYNISWLSGRYEFEVAAFDKNGLYSKFIPLAPH
jgi:hypothetical protein